MEEDSKNTSRSCFDLNIPHRVVIARTAVVYGETPAGIQRKQIVKIAERMKMDPVILCEKILNMTDQERFTLIKNFNQDNPILQTFYENFHSYKINSSNTKCNESSPTHKLQKKTYQRILESNINEINNYKLNSKAQYFSKIPAKIPKQDMPITIDNFEAKILDCSSNLVLVGSDKISNIEANTLCNFDHGSNSKNMLLSTSDKSTFVEANEGTSNIKCVDHPLNFSKRKYDFNFDSNDFNGYDDHTVNESSNNLLTSLLFDDSWRKLNNYGSEKEAAITSTSKNVIATNNKPIANETIVYEPKNYKAKDSNIFPSNKLLESLLFD